MQFIQLFYKKQYNLCMYLVSLANELLQIYTDTAKVPNIGYVL